MVKREEDFTSSKWKTEDSCLNISNAHFWCPEIGPASSLISESRDISKQDFWERLNYKLSSQLCFVQQILAARESCFLIWITFKARVLLLLLFGSGLFAEELWRTASEGYPWTSVSLSLIPKGVLIAPFEALVSSLGSWWSVSVESAASARSVATSVVVISVSALLNDIREFINVFDAEGNGLSKFALSIAFLNSLCLNFRNIKYSS